MSRLQRNTSGLEEHAQKKRDEAFQQTEEAINTLLLSKRPINYSTVASEAGVSRTWLYKEPEIRARIEELRQQTSPKKKRLPLEAVDPVVHAEIQTLQQRIKRLEIENKALKNHLEVVYEMAEPELLKRIEALETENKNLKKRLELNTENNEDNQHLQQKIKTLEWEKKELKKQKDEFAEKFYRNQNLLAVFNEVKEETKRQAQIIRELKAQLELSESPSTTENSVKDTVRNTVSLDRKRQEKENHHGLSNESEQFPTPSPQVTDEVAQELKRLGIRLNKTLIELIVSVSPQEVQNALAVVGEAITSGKKLNSKAGFFRKALEEGWTPNFTPGERQLNQVKENFLEWFNLARAEGIVQASQRTPDGSGILVLEPTGEWTPLTTMFEKGWTLEYLQQISKR